MAALEMEKISRVHFVGIGGIGMSALARLFLHEKKYVSGSDRGKSEITEVLGTLGADVRYEQVPENINAELDLVIYTDAMPKDHLELLAARKLNIPTLSYFEALGAIANRYYLIAVAGTHGKTTTTAMLVDIFEAAGEDPTAIVGSLRLKTKSNFRSGKSKYFIVEADEYLRHFLHFTPDILVITNIDADHLDYYKDLEEIQLAFRELTKKVRDGGAVIMDTGQKNSHALLRGLSARAVNYAPYIDVRLPLKIAGLHNYQNAAAAAAAAEFAGIPKGTVESALSAFSGTWRRFEYKGKTKTGADVYDDYAHHPTEIRSTLKALREKEPEKRIIAIFHPHLFSRTKLLFTDFANAFQNADKVVVAPIYAARESESDGLVTHKSLAAAISESKTDAVGLDSFEEIENEMRSEDSGAVIITMGAGDIYKVAEKLVNS